MKRSPIRRKPHKDPVTQELWQQVIERDRKEARARGMTNPCVAAFLYPLTSGTCWGPLTLDHVRDQPMMGKRAPSDERHLVTLCYEHHLNSGWATSHRDVLRWYLRTLYDSEH